MASPDPLTPQQWALSQPAAVGAAEAWTRSSGRSVVVAVLDSGVQIDHPDLADNLWTNPGEVAGNGRDDDANGFVDDVHGANMRDARANVADDNGHGTHVAGIIAASQGNGVGGSGLAPGARIMVVKVLDASLAGDTNVLAGGIRYAVDEGARILNVSVNSNLSSPALTAAVRYAGERGATIVASAGNDGRSLDLLPSFPAALPDPAVLCVTAATATGGLWPLANLGLTSVDVAAPGDRILSTTRGSAYSYMKGTSMAAPFVSATLALMAAAGPELAQSALRDLLLATTRRSRLLAPLLRAGSLDAGAALRRFAPATSSDEAAPAQGLTLRTGRASRAGARATLRWDAPGAGAVARWRVSLDGRVVATLPAGRHMFTRRVARAGRHRWRVVGFDGQGAKLLAARRAFRVLR